MALNVEVKAKVNRPNRLNEALDEIGAKPQPPVSQEDTFFSVHRGRLKMRCDQNDQCELIYYRRRNELGPKISSYFRRKLSDAEKSRRELTSLFGIKGIVRKQRRVFMINDVRIHVDDVEGLGEFLEIEVPISNASEEHRAKQVARRLMNSLGIMPTELLSIAYEEMNDGQTELVMQWNGEDK